MEDKYVVDTCALISYYPEIFKEKSSISNKSLEIIDYSFYSSEVKLIFPSTVFIEIFLKWCTSEEMKRKIEFEIFRRIKSKANMEIQPFDKEILENFVQIIDIEKDHNFDNHDKQILASAMTMYCPLITSDKRIKRYNNRKNVIPYICD